jgi:hypothetical protein
VFTYEFICTIVTPLKQTTKGSKMNKLSKETKKQRKVRVGMNAITKINFKVGFAPPRFAGKDGFMKDGKLMPAFSKIIHGTPYVNPLNFA